ncbi:unnamed protein product [Darwinula stevensoni]|uniref:Dynein axonemal intermediate chain 4 n=1 Tax=Darwinula stevensoni TaxID=69355 RepID=A0A7R8X6X0_9CRUS|nr:unnamed protein product [Darwinula stevensoni]CAG0881922.1 unnamed protein product [Darwinula stevensoni]
MSKFKITKSQFQDMSRLSEETVVDEFGNDVTPLPLVDVTGTEDNSYLDWEKDLVHFFPPTSLLGELKPSRSSSRLSMHSVISIDSAQHTSLSDHDSSKSSLLARVVLYMQETETFWHLEIVGIIVQAGTAEAASVEKRNEAYKKLCAFKEGSDRYMEHETQTLYPPSKTKSTQTHSIRRLSQSCQATSWDMYDHLHSPTPSEKMDVHFEERNQRGDNRGESPDLLSSLLIMQRFIHLNEFSPQYSCYCDLMPIDKVPSLSEEWYRTLKNRKKKRALQKRILGVPAEKQPSIHLLWTYSSPLFMGENVGGITINPQNPHLVAASYCQRGFMNQHNGYVACWSIKNPSCPEKSYNMSSGALCCSFATIHSNLLAVGCYDGTVCVFDVSTPHSCPLAHSVGNGVHSGPVWQVLWIKLRKKVLSFGPVEERRNDHETLVSVGEEGMISQYVLGSNVLVGKPLISLRHMGDDTGDLRSFCMAFDSACETVLCGTGDGGILMYRLSDTDSVANVYKGHTGPVYEIQWNPHAKDVFISCSGDWTVKFWHASFTQPLLTLNTSEGAEGCCWSQTHSTMLALVYLNALEIWDISEDTLHPVALLPAPEEPDGSFHGFTALHFSPILDTLLLGDECGRLHVLKLKKLAEAPSHENQNLLIFAARNPYTFLFYILLCLTPFFMVSAFLSFKLMKAIEARDKEQQRRSKRASNVAKLRKKKD